MRILKIIPSLHVEFWHSKRLEEKLTGQIKIKEEYDSYVTTEAQSELEEDFDWDKETKIFYNPTFYSKTRMIQYYFIDLLKEINENELNP